LDYASRIFYRKQTRDKEEKAREIKSFEIEANEAIAQYEWEISSDYAWNTVAA
jgi:hypothetical protein